jgi:uncharacterized membrane protein YqiK
MIIVGAVLVAAPIFFSSTLGRVGGLAAVVLGVLLLAIGLIIWMFRFFYVKPAANEAFVITGLQGGKVLIDKGGWFLSAVQELVPVSLETMKLDVERIGQDALITKDNLRVDVRGEFYIKVLPNRDDVLNAARSLGEKSVTAEAVSDLVFEKLVSALRSVAATKDLVQIHAQRDEFASAVQQLVTSDLNQNGLTLESVTVSRFDQTSQDMLLDNNIFDAQGKKKITEITQAALIERNRIEQEALQEITMKNVNTRKVTLELEREQAEAEAIQQTQIAKAKSEQQRDSEIYRISQQRQVETSDIERQKMIELAERQKQIEVAEAERLRSEAEALFLKAQAAREEAQQQIVMVQRLAEAEREAQTKLIAAKQNIEEDRIRQETDATVDAFTEVKKAEAQKEAAVLEAEAIRTKAQAEADSRTLFAKGDTAIKQVDVNIERERVAVEQARVEVERQALENREQFSHAAIEFEVQKLRIEAQRDVQVALAKAIAEFMSKGNMNIYGSPETMSNMMAQYTKGMGLGQLVDGVFEGSDKLTGPEVQALLGRLQSMVAGFQKAQPETVEAQPRPTSAADD